MVLVPGKDPLVKKFVELSSEVRGDSEQDRATISVSAQMALASAMSIFRMTEAVGLVAMLDVLDRFASIRVSPNGGEFKDGSVVVRELTPEERSLWDDYVKSDHKTRAVISDAVQVIYQALLSTHLTRIAALKVAPGDNEYIAEAPDGRMVLAEEPVEHVCTNCGKCKEDNRNVVDGVPHDRLMDGEQN